MGLDRTIKRNATKLIFKVPTPENTSKRALYPYQKILVEYAAQYIKHNYPGAKNAWRQPITYQEVYDGRKYLQLTLRIYNHLNEEKIIEVGLRI